MGLISYKGVLYGGGSDVEANPTGSATDTLTKVGIDGTVYEVTDADAVHTSDIGTANGVAELDANGLVPSSQLPSYVDDVLEYASVSAFPATGETGKIYVALDTNLTYRWSGSAYVEISPSLALGETSSTAYRGDRGKTAYDHATESGRSGAKSAGLYKIGVTAQGHIASATAVAKADLTALGVADQNDVDAIEEDIEGFKTATGKYITINDAAALPAESYSLTLSPVQEGSGDPSPSNVRPIHGADEVGVRVCGKNLWSIDTYFGKADGSGSYTYANDTLTLTGKYYFQFNIEVRKNTTYTLSFDIVSSSVYSNAAFYTVKANGTIDQPISNQSGSTDTKKIINTGENEKVALLLYSGNSTSGTTVYKDIQFEQGSTATEYEAFNGHSTTITLPSTVYGGSVDMGGSGVSNMASVDLGSANWTKANSPIEGRSYFFTGDFRSNIKTGMPVTSKTNIISSNYATSAFYNLFNDNIDNVIGCDGSGYIAIVDSAYNSADAATFKTAMSGVQLVYELATPTDITVTPFPQTLLEGVNNVWAEMVENNVVIDNAQQSLTYQPQNIVGQLRQEIEAKPDSFTQLSDTSFSNLANGQIPKWNSTSGKWENANESGGGGASSLAELSDTNISSPADGQILKWNGTTSKWVNAAEYSYTLPTASASTKGGIKVGDNLSMNGEVLSAKTVPWTKIWNYRSGTSPVTIPSGTTEIMLAIVYTYDTIDYAESVTYPFNSGYNYNLGYYESYSSKWMSAAIRGDGSFPRFVYTDGSSIPSYYDFEVWAR